MTKDERYAIARALANVEIKALSVELLPEDRTHIRELFVESFADVFAWDQEALENRVDAIRMTS